jgi:hypothetical protein
MLVSKSSDAYGEKVYFANNAMGRLGIENTSFHLGFFFGGA